MKLSIFIISVLVPLIGWSRMTEISKSSNQFAFDLFASEALQTGNVFYSPLSISATLAMTSAGAQKETEKRMKKVLHLPTYPHPLYKELLGQLKSSSDFQLLIANRIWGQQSSTYLPKFLKVLKDNYQAEMGQLRFREEPEPSRLEINKWVAEQTQGKIPELLKAGDIAPDTDLVLTNAIYFKGQWKLKFDEKQTQSDEFQISADQKQQIPFMNQTASFEYAESPEFQMVSMPYQGEELAFVAVLPKADKQSVELQFKSFEPLYKAIKPTRVQLQMPKFKANASMQMKEVLSQMGMALAFDPEKANFKGIRKLQPGENLFISKVVHQAMVDVNEEGTEAAAATAAVVAVRMSALMPKPPIVMKLNRPFSYLILHRKSGAILFLGRYQKPN
ncbi:MAG: serpin family protein [Pseudobdellovibrionaceae bacterium]